MVQILQAKALFDCHGDEDSELTFLEGDILTDVRVTSEDGWLHGRLERTGEEGLFPDNYVELIHVAASPAPSKAAGPPQLPARSTPALTASPALEESQRSLLVNTDVSTHAVPAAQAQTSTLGTRSYRGPGTTSSLVLDKPSPSKTALLGAESRSMYGTPTQPAAIGLGQGRPTPGPPALPRRSTTLDQVSTPDEEDPSPGPALSVRERMANLSMASQRGFGSPAVSQSGRPPSRPSANELTQRVAPDVNTRSPLSSAAKPALPPRTSTGSPVNSAVRAGSTSGGINTNTTSSGHIATAPAPKLTTFSRPRSARTSKSSSPTTQKSTPPPTSKEDLSASTPPKLPARMGSGNGTPTMSPATVIEESADANGASGPVRFSPVAIRHIPSELSALPAITRNSQPLPLPSRTINTPAALSSPSAKTSIGLARSATTGASRAVGSQDSELHTGPAGAAFGVRLNSIGSKIAPLDAKGDKDNSSIFSNTPSNGNDFAPPLPARSNTIASTPAKRIEDFTKVPAPITASQKDTFQRPFADSPSRVQPIQRDLQMQGSTAQLSQVQQLKPRPQMLGSQATNSVGGWDSRMGTTGSRVAIPPARGPEATTSENLGVKPEARRRYETLFKSVSSGEYIEGAKVHAIYVRSRLDSKTLAQIWDLVDVDNAGRLSRAQFCMGLYLIDERLASGLIPLEVSDELWVSVMQ
ncbi:Increased rDNA silencing protein [Mortierella alpina]|nr:Increased rDNA silencing protein [Mortierella alpina]